MVAYITDPALAYQPQGQPRQMRAQKRCLHLSALLQGNKKVTWKKLRRKTKTFFCFRFFEKFWLGGAAPQTPRFLAGGAKPPQTPPPLYGCLSHLIEAAKRGRLDQMIFFSAPLTTRAPPTTVRRPSHDRPLAVRQPSTVPTVLRYLLFLPEN